MIGTLALVQARMGSKRLPGKVLKRIDGKPLIEILLQRLSRAKNIDKISLVTGLGVENDSLVDCVEKLGYEVFRGSEDDVLDRYYQAAKLYRPEVVVRITGDCPLIDPNIVDDVIELYKKSKADYASNINPPTYPDGLDTEVFSFRALEIAHRNATTTYDREHVTPLLRKNSRLKAVNLFSDEDYSCERWTVDYLEDLEVIKKILNHFVGDLDFSWKDVMRLKHANPGSFFANKSIRRNATSETGAG